ncbi:MAG TPA: hypothetical protein PKD34_01170 [Candidatus Doudnabacteria bacterium]|nr:hypothetical protein [Candidatus Doudnabacteria bacterium]
MKKISVSKNFFVPQNSYEQFGMQVYKLLVENFSQTFFVGGMVRDLLFNNKISDIDIATEATPEQIVSLFKTGKFDINTSAIKFGAISLSKGKYEVQITTFRKDIYEKNRYPRVGFTKSLSIDSKRRDFSMNSLYFQPFLNVVMDPHEGIRDINLRTLRAIGNVDTKLKEDPLRIVRAYRFAMQFNLQFDNKLSKAIDDNVHLVNGISKAKLISEINKTASQKIKNFLLQKFV